MRLFYREYKGKYLHQKKIGMRWADYAYVMEIAGVTPRKKQEIKRGAVWWRLFMWIIGFTILGVLVYGVYWIMTEGEGFLALVVGVGLFMLLIFGEVFVAIGGYVIKWIAKSRRGAHLDDSSIVLPFCEAVNLRRYRVKLCLVCGYDLRHMNGGECPECGQWYAGECEDKEEREEIERKRAEEKALLKRIGRISTVKTLAVLAPVLLLCFWGFESAADGYVFYKEPTFIMSCVLLLVTVVVMCAIYFRRLSQLLRESQKIWEEMSCDTMSRIP
ncbi:hypothetical protein [Poriferisphaera sp. WC338]|uniref:hypothetical protein n=1 Tax=Poriferisphaera sp. WC338 TaxID=3425129 RepID=UPI003D81B6E0